MPRGTPKTQLPLSPDAIEELRQQRRFVAFLRAGLIVFVAVVAILAIVKETNPEQLTGEPPSTLLGVVLHDWWWVALLAVSGFVTTIVAVDILTPKRKLTTISAILLGTFAGVLATAMVGFVIDLFIATYFETPETSVSQQIARLVLTVKVIIGLGLSYLGITTVLQTQDDFRLVIPYVEFAKRFRGPKPILVDTSALIDARLVGLVEAGLIQTPILIPGFVVDELQTLADSTDRLKRARGRRGLDSIKTLQRSTELTIESSRQQPAGVDRSLLDMAQALPACILTTDTGLASVAQIAGVQCVNLNALALALKPDYLAGSTFNIEIIRRGEQAGQGVGYLDDGTMVVIEHAEDAVGQRVDAVVRTTMQTAAGKLVFARLADHPDDNPDKDHDETPDEQHADTNEQSPQQPRNPETDANLPDQQSRRTMSPQRASPRPPAPGRNPRRG